DGVVSSRAFRLLGWRIVCLLVRPSVRPSTLNLFQYNNNNNNNNNRNSQFQASERTGKSRLANQQCETRIGTRLAF
ncbi:MAG: hypothetical protein N7Q72_03505, partial [Spiroplasma sp. Tabriz.8]|nr:hypothetical protein [Spiroplasma sp. Tabriz.8]